jgi:hypothetical protein
VQRSHCGRDSLCSESLGRSRAIPGGRIELDPKQRRGGENWTGLASLIETCELNGVNPQTYFADPLTRLVNGWPQACIGELMPWHDLQP